MQNAWSKTLTRMRRLFDRRHGTTTDDELLRRYVEHADRAALELLVWRHGLMVYNVCRQLLRCSHDADDAFQAVFLILAKKARSIRHGAALAGWLHRVALRVVHEAIRRQKRLRESVTVGVVDPVAPDVSSPEERESQRLLHEELDHLPSRFRLPLVLCYLEGKSNAEAAGELGVPEGTIYSRLARGREKLRRRLERRGVALGAAALGGAVPSADAALAALVPPTVSAAAAFVARGAPLITITVSSVSLAKGVLHTMWLKSCTIACGVALLAGVLGLTGWHWLQPAPAQEAGTPPAQSPQTPKESPLTQLLKKKVDSAKLSFDDWMRTLEIGKTGDYMAVYERSRMWLNAERELRPNESAAALTAHRDRVKLIYDWAKVHFDGGRIREGIFFDCEYVLAEAEVWLLRGKEKR